MFVEPPGAAPGEAEPSTELGATVQHQSIGLFSLEIPYPRPHFRYSVAWKLPDGPQLSPAAEQFREVAKRKANAEQLVGAYFEALGQSLWTKIRSPMSLALYVPVENQTVLIKTGKRREPSYSDWGAPAELSLRNDNRLHRRAWWGGVRAALRESPQDDEPGLSSSERAVILVPIRKPGQENDLAWGLIRIGIPTKNGPAVTDLSDLLGKGDNLKEFADGIPFMLQKTSQLL